MGTFDKMFDFNHDGELSPMVKGAKWGLINYLLNDEDDSRDDEFDEDSDESDQDD